jgi:hypothetical protein
MGESTTMRQWSSAEIAKPTGTLCGHRQWKFPYKTCNEQQGHTGDHCSTSQCGTQVVRVWWSKD